MKSHMSLVGEGQQTVIKAPYNTYPLIYCINVTNAAISNLVLDGGLHRHQERQLFCRHQ